MSQTIKGYTETWFELCNADGHPLALSVSNSFSTEAQAAAAASQTCIDYRDTVTVKEHVTTVRRVFNVSVAAIEVP